MVLVAHENNIRFFPENVSVMFVNGKIVQIRPPRNPKNKLICSQLLDEDSSSFLFSKMRIQSNLY